MRTWQGSVYLGKHSDAFWRLVDLDFVNFDRPNSSYPTSEDPGDCYWSLRSPNGRAPWEGGEYTGSTAVEFANHRSLLADFGQEDDLLLVDESAHTGYGFHFGFQVHSDFGTGEFQEHASKLVDTLEWLVHEYPLYNDEVEWEIVEEWALKAWESFTHSDLSSEVESLTGLDYDLSSARAYNAFRELCNEKDLESPYAEAHESVIFPGTGDKEFLVDLAWSLTDFVTDDGYEVDELTDLGVKIYSTCHLEDWHASHPQHPSQGTL